MGSLLIQKVHPAIETRPPKQGETFRMEHYQPDVDKDIFYLKVDSKTTDVVIVPENMEDLDPNIIAVEYKKEEKAAPATPRAAAPGKPGMNLVVCTTKPHCVR